MAPTVLTSRKASPHAQTLAHLRMLCQTDLYKFAAQVLFAHLTPNLLTPTLHQPLAQAMMTSPYDENLYLLSRGFFKSSLITTAAVIQRILGEPDTHWCRRRWRGRMCGPNTRILIASNKGENAEGFLAGIKGHLESNEILLRLFPEILVRDPQRAAREWTQGAITVQRSRRDLRESTIQTIGVTGELVSRHYDHGVFDDCVGRENSTTKDEREKVWDFLNKARPLFDPGSTKDFVGCLAASAEVTLGDGTRVPIDRVKVGDRVWSADEDGALGERRVLAMIPQGLAATVTVTTTAHTLRATPTHPFLALRDGGLRWVRADAVQSGEYVVALKDIPAGRFFQPPWLSEEFAWVFGFLLGDGWAGVKGHRGYVEIALGVDEALNTRVVEAARRCFPGRARWRLTATRTARSDHRSNAVFLQTLGLVGTAKTKRMPVWVYRMRAEDRLALLRGFCDADGTRVPAHQDVRRVEIANQGLLEDLRHLAALCGVRVGRLRGRRRVIQAPGSPAPTVSETWNCTFNFSTPTQDEFRALGRGQGFRTVPPVSPTPSPGLRPERVLSVTVNPGLEPVYDLTVEGTPSFFANGLAVHNTHWHYDDAYARMKALRQAGTMRLGVYELPCWGPTHARTPDDPEVRAGVVGDVPGHGWVRVHFPERFCLDKPDPLDDTDQRLELLPERRRAPSNFNAQYLLNPVSADDAHFLREDLLLEDAPPPLEDLWIAMSIDPAISLKEHADYSAIAIGGFDRASELWLLELWQGKRDDYALVQQIFTLYGRYAHAGVKVVGFESVGFSRAYRHLITTEGERRGQYLPIIALPRDTRNTKQVRIGGLQGQWKARQIHALRSCAALGEFLEQAEKFRMDKESAHDDLLDAVADLYELRGRPSGPAPFLSDEAAERARWEQDLQRRSPQLDAMSRRVAWTHHQARQQDADLAEREALSGVGGTWWG